MPKIKVLVVDDSILFRETLSRALAKDPQIEVVGTAGDPYEARDKILKFRPNVMTLDVEMPKMNGIEFLRTLIPQYPLPTVVVTSTPLNAFEAINAGAVEYIKKPLARTPADIQAFADSLTSTVKVAAIAKVKSKSVTNVHSNFSPNEYKIVNNNKIIALGASTGGTDALQAVVQDLPANTPGIIIVQHMPAGFTKMYAERLNRICKMKVKEAQDKDRVVPGQIIVAAGEYHLRLCKDTRGYYISSQMGEKVSGHCPSVDVMFDSVATVAGANAIGAILTGMGSDGAKGLLKMRQAGSFTIGQDKDSCVVYGMPMVAFNIGAVCQQASLDKIPQLILSKCR